MLCRITCGRPRRIAIVNAVSPLLFVASASAPASSNARTTSKRPSVEASRIRWGLGLRLCSDEKPLPKESLRHRSVHRDKHRPHHVVFGCHGRKIIACPCGIGRNARARHVRRDIHGGRSRGLSAEMSVPGTHGTTRGNGRAIGDRRSEDDSPSGLRLVHCEQIRVWSQRKILRHCAASGKQALQLRCT